MDQEEQTRRLKEYTDIAIEHGLSSLEAFLYRNSVTDKDLLSLIRLTDFFFRSAREILGLDFKE